MLQLCSAFHFLTAYYFEWPASPPCLLCVVSLLSLQELLVYQLTSNSFVSSCPPSSITHFILPEAVFLGFRYELKDLLQPLVSFTNDLRAKLYILHTCNFVSFLHHHPSYLESHTSIFKTLPLSHFFSGGTFKSDSNFLLLP